MEYAATKKRDTLVIKLSAASGSIEPNLEKQPRLHELQERLRDREFHKPIPEKDGRPVVVPTKCIDGRPGGLGLGPKAAGGTLTLTIADDLINHRFEDLTESHLMLCELLLIEGHDLGVHRADHTQDANCGCAACDKLSVIYNYIAQNPEHLQDMSRSLGINVTDQTIDKITAGAKKRTNFPTGPQLVDTTERLGGEQSVENLTGEHKEAVVVINWQNSTSLDRPMLEEEFGDDYQVFNVDAWVFEESAKQMTNDPEEIRELTAAMLVFNIAAINCLCSNKMQLVDLH